MKKKVKVKKSKMLLITLSIIFLVILVIYLSVFGFDIKKVSPGSDCSKGLVRVGSVADIDIYTYCIKKIKFNKNISENLTKEEFLRGTVYYNMIWDGGSRYYRGINYSIVECRNHEISKAHRYIITNKDYADRAWKYC